MTTPTPRHPAYDMETDELRNICRRYLRGTPNGGLSRARRDDLLTWVIINRLIERRDEAQARRAAEQPRQAPSTGQA